MRYALLLFLPLAAAQTTFELAPKVKQGEAGSSVARSHDKRPATPKDKTVSVFPLENGTAEGWMPVSIVEKPGPYKIEIKDAKGTVLHSAQIEVEDAHYPKQNIHPTKTMKTLTPLPGEMEAVHALQRTVSEKRMWAEPFVVPAPQCMNSRFGVQRLLNGVFKGNYHRGLDLRSPLGPPVKATAAGTVRISQMFRLHGGTVGIDHGQGFTSIDRHMPHLCLPRRP